jgi:hypothetical protein
LQDEESIEANLLFDSFWNLIARFKTNLSLVDDNNPGGIVMDYPF